MALLEIRIHLFAELSAKLVVPIDTHRRLLDAWTGRRFGIGSDPRAATDDTTGTRTGSHRKTWTQTEAASARGKHDGNRIGDGSPSAANRWGCVPNNSTRYDPTVDGVDGAAIDAGDAKSIAIGRPRPVHASVRFYAVPARRLKHTHEHWWTYADAWWLLCVHAARPSRHHDTATLEPWTNRVDTKSASGPGLVHIEWRRNGRLCEHGIQRRRCYGIGYVGADS